MQDSFKYCDEKGRYCAENSNYDQLNTQMDYKNFYCDDGSVKFTQLFQFKCTYYKRPYTAGPCYPADKCLECREVSSTAIHGFPLFRQANYLTFTIYPLYSSRYTLCTERGQFSG